MRKIALVWFVYVVSLISTAGFVWVKQIVIKIRSNQKNVEPLRNINVDVTQVFLHGINQQNRCFMFTTILESFTSDIILFNLKYWWP